MLERRSFFSFPTAFNKAKPEDATTDPRRIVERRRLDRRCEELDAAAPSSREEFRMLTTESCLVGAPGSASSELLADAGETAGRINVGEARTRIDLARDMLPPRPPRLPPPLPPPPLPLLSLPPTEGKIGGGRGRGGGSGAAEHGRGC